MEWEQKGGTYWVRYVHVEILGFISASAAPESCEASTTVIRIGDRVRVRPSVTTPKYKWGSVTHRSIGVVISNPRYHFILHKSKGVLVGIERNGDVTVNFPEQNRWTGLLSEIEHADGPDVDCLDGNGPSPSLGSFDSTTSTTGASMPGKGQPPSEIVLKRKLFKMPTCFIQI